MKADFATRLLAWYDANRRALPWRESPSLYATVVSEFMCQQTQVATVLPYFARWMQTWPDFAALARADEARVLKHWEGLGYYNRARNLHRLARQWVAAEEKPVTAAQWRAFPGVGAYTAAAIASIAHGDHAAVVDGNVVRVLARLDRVEDEFPDNTRAVSFFTPRAQSLIEGSARPGDHNQAMMELGATVCVKASPRCLLCPFREDCRARAEGDPGVLPRLRRKATVKRQVNRALILEKEALLLHRIPPESRRLAGLIELPTWEQVGPSAPPGSPLLTRQRGIAQERIEERFYPVTANAKLRAAVKADPTLFWQPVATLDAVTLTGPHRKWLPALLKAAGKVT